MMIFEQLSWRAIAFGAVLGAAAAIATCTMVKRPSIDCREENGAWVCMGPAAAAARANDATEAEIIRPRDLQH